MTTQVSQHRTYGSVTTRPVKRFFVEMLTRDIAVEDAILDLLDNCVDGVQRTIAAGRQRDLSIPGDSSDSRPYQGFWARITVDRDKFEIRDNCGGIPWSEHDRAFRMGRPEPTPDRPAPEPPLTVGTYGIGMKRAIFKMGNAAEIETQHGADAYRVPISADWIAEEDEWDLGVSPAQSRTEDGTRITVEELHTGVSERFAARAFKEDLLDKIQSHYAVIIHKGFRVEVNGTPALPKPILFRFAAEDAAYPIRPYIFQVQQYGVQVFLAIGLREPIPDVERFLEELKEPRFSSEYAGWTVICNDRVVLYCSRDELTGWGTGGVPRYHTQFIALSGVVEFCGDASKLPTTTTKRGLDVSSPLYQQVLDRMRAGTKLFVNYTNKWKTRQEEAKAQVSPIPAISYPDLRRRALELPFAPVRVGLPGEQYRPKLPQPPKETEDVRISYFRDKRKVWRLAEELLSGLPDLRDSQVQRAVGEASFDLIYSQMVGARQEQSGDR